MRERPILFSGAMVREIIAGRKTQTRRLIKAPRGCTVMVDDRDGTREVMVDRAPHVDFGDWHDYPCPHGAPGDRLWVRETWRTEERASDLVDGVRLRADDLFVPIVSTPEAANLWIDAHENGKHGAKWRPSIFMRRWMSRLLLDITQVRVERVQDISEADILAEGCTVDVVARATNTPWSDLPTLHHAWERMWRHINGDASWDENPWCWAIGFEGAR